MFRGRGSHYLKLERVSENFLIIFTEAMKSKARAHNVDTLVHAYNFGSPEKVIPGTKTVCNYIHQGLLDIKPIDFSKVVRICILPTKKYLVFYRIQMIVQLLVIEKRLLYLA